MAKAPPAKKRLPDELVEKLDNNTQILVDSIYVLSTHWQAISRVVEDIVLGVPPLLKVGADGKRAVDFDAYVAKVREAQEQPSLLAAASDDEVRIFGGTGEIQ
jgi:hypothetical protein